MAGLTLDSGALIAYERADRRVIVHLKEAERRGCELTVSAAVLAEVWRGGKRSARVAVLLQACIIEPVDEDLGRTAGEAQAAVRSASAIDAIVVASAARRGDRVLTSDIGDLARLADFFPGVRLVAL